MRMRLTPHDDNDHFRIYGGGGGNILMCKENKEKQRSKRNSGKSFFLHKPGPCSVK